MPAFSQQLNLSFGPAFPVGSFASKDGNDPASGLAKLGWMADLSYMHRLEKSNHFGFVGLVRGRLNGISGEGAVSVFKEQFSTYQWRVSSGSLWCI